MRRSIFSVLAGLLVAGVIIASGEFLRTRWYSPTGYTSSKATAAEVERARRRLQMNRALLTQGRYQDAYFQAEAIVHDLPIGQLFAMLVFCAVGAMVGAG